MINFSMDFLSLYAAGRLMVLRLSAKRLTAAAIIGALYGVLSTVLGWSGIVGAIGAMLASAVMTAAAFGFEGWGGFVRTTLAVWGCGALLGGALTLLCGFFGGELPGGGVPDLLGAAALATWGFVRTVSRRLRRGYAEIRFSYRGREYRGRALSDSGNLLTDPLSGLPVILVTAEQARGFAGEETDLLFRGVPDPSGRSDGGVRAVPCRTAAGGKMLYGFLCTDVHIEFERKLCRRSAVICIDHETESYGGCGVLMPACLIP